MRIFTWKEQGRKEKVMVKKFAYGPHKRIRDSQNSIKKLKMMVSV
jgi:hypothetical protein